MRTLLWGENCQKLYKLEASDLKHWRKTTKIEEKESGMRNELIVLINGYKEDINYIGIIFYIFI